MTINKGPPYQQGGGGACPPPYQQGGRWGASAQDKWPSISLWWLRCGHCEEEELPYTTTNAGRDRRLSEGSAVVKEVGK